ncbi:MAG: outer membrane lipid asymmetry maintenance protein MlaD [Desulfobacterales bacterium]|jgi:phospholipid/cholesterol/gamma-HCH transport system substrate-binding protein|nr:outer membrane lipid asymmetry maintenance protein MlaD [Desulfobacterales bacterium]
MRKYHHEAVAGIFVVIGLLCVGFMAVKLGKVNLLGDDTYPLRARFTAISGLRVGNPVEMLGIEIGRVTGFDVDQKDQMAVVQLRIRKDIIIFNDAIASIKTAGLIGDKYISIDAGGAGEILKPDGTITETEASIEIGDLIRKYAFGEVKK